MPFSFSTALSGLRASSEALSVTGNNIANANTTAYKGSSIRFADMFNSTLGARLNGAGNSLQIGTGVTTSAIQTNFAQGGLSDAGSATSAAIQGNGFFVVSDDAGVFSYTRAGDFSIDRGGYLVTPDGQKVQGYAAVNGSVPPSAVLSALRLPVGETLAPSMTTNATLRMNLNSADAPGAEFHAPVQVFDSRGVQHSLDLHFTKQNDGSYLLRATLDGAAADASADGGAPSSAPVSVTFDANGQLLTPATLSIAPDQTRLNGAVLPSIDINLRQMNPDGTPGDPLLTNYATASTVNATDQDGFAAGTLSGFALSAERDGTITAVFSNGQSRPIGRFALATFNAQTGLRHVGGNRFMETGASGQPSLGAAGSGGRGDVVGGALEQSNVDIATEFTELIVAQRSFQANSRVINTINQTMQDLLQVV